MSVASRVKELRHVRYGDIQDSPWHFHEHDDFQTQVVEASFDRLGAFKPLLVWERPDGSLAAFDGHLRKAIAPDFIGPVAVTDLDDDEAREAILLADPTAGLSTVDPDRLAALLEDVDLDTPALGAFVDELREQAGLFLDAVPEGSTAGGAYATPAHLAGAEHPTPQQGNTTEGADTMSVILVLPSAEYQEFLEYIRRLTVHFETTTLAATVLAAFREVIASISE